MVGLPQGRGRVFGERNSVSPCHRNTRGQPLVALLADEQEVHGVVVQEVHGVVVRSSMRHCVARQALAETRPTGFRCLPSHPPQRG